MHALIRGRRSAAVDGDGGAYCGPVSTSCDRICWKDTSLGKPMFSVDCLGAPLLLAALVHLAYTAINRGKISDPASNLGDAGKRTLEPRRRGLGFLGWKANWPGLALGIAARLLAVLSSRHTGVDFRPLRPRPNVGCHSHRACSIQLVRRSPCIALLTRIAMKLHWLGRPTRGTLGLVGRFSKGRAPGATRRSRGRLCAVRRRRLTWVKRPPLGHATWRPQ